MTNVGQTIYSQLLPFRNSLMCWGARNFKTFNENSFKDIPHLGGLFFQVSGLLFSGKVIIRLKPNDTYQVSIGVLSKGQFKIKETKDEVYFDELESAIDSLVEGTLDKSPNESLAI